MDQAFFWFAAGGAALMIVLSAVAEWRRGRRRTLDNVGWVPWTTVHALSWFALAISLILAIKAG